GALAEMKALIFALRPEALREEGIVAAIRKQADALMARDDLVVQLDCPDDPIPLPPDVEEELYRLSQEALSNVVRHANAERLNIRLEVGSASNGGSSGSLMLEIADDGVGFDPGVHRPGHLGLKTMAQRAERMGGRLEVQSGGARGTVVRLTVPLQESHRGVAPEAAASKP
ncbi:MAG TPA: ATP-binding protein, partial [Actinomycetota bacterium]|nr:ATP-binding protein [Actinomycetota bacterium]